MQHFSDRLATAIRTRRSVVCVGLDPILERMPRELVEKYRPQAAELGEEAAVAACFQEFCSGVIDAVADVAACVKPQAAFFEQYGAAGWRALGAVIRCAHEYDLPVILDVKRGDIASTGAAYGHAAFGGAAGFAGPAAGIGADAITASPYLGDDSLQPLVDHCASGHGVFILTRTSNPGASLLQEVEVDGRPLFLRVADLVRELGAAHVGEAGYSDVGAVAGATAPAQLRAVREVLPNAFLLVPGYGAQGAGADALAGVAAGDAAGFVVNASRSIIFAWQDSRRRLSQGCGRRRRIYAQRPPGQSVTDETPKKGTRRPRSASADGTPPDADQGAVGAANDPDAALRRLESMGTAPAAAPDVGAFADPEPLPPAPAVDSFSAPPPSRPQRPMGGSKRTPRVPAASRRGSRTTRTVARIAAPVVFLVAVIALIGIVVNSGVVGAPTSLRSRRPSRRPRPPR